MAWTRSASASRMLDLPSPAVACRQQLTPPGLRLCHRGVHGGQDTVAADQPRTCVRGKTTVMLWITGRKGRWCTSSKRVGWQMLKGGRRR